jgi:hypothetical protein
MSAEIYAKVFRRKSKGNYILGYLRGSPPRRRCRRSLGIAYVVVMLYAFFGCDYCAGNGQVSTESSPMFLTEDVGVIESAVHHKIILSVLPIFKVSLRHNYRLSMVVEPFCRDGCKLIRVLQAAGNGISHAISGFERWRLHRPALFKTGTSDKGAGHCFSYIYPRNFDSRGFTRDRNKFLWGNCEFHPCSLIEMHLNGAVPDTPNDPNGADKGKSDCQQRQFIEASIFPKLEFRDGGLTAPGVPLYLFVTCFAAPIIVGFIGLFLKNRENRYFALLFALIGLSGYAVFLFLSKDILWSF